MSSNLTQFEFEIRVNDIFDELSDENQRLNKEFIFANNCLTVLNKFKLLLNQIYIKYEANIDSEDKEKLNGLEDEFNSLIKSDEEIYRYVVKKEDSESTEDLSEDLNTDKTKEQIVETNCEQIEDNDINCEELSETNSCLSDETIIIKDFSQNVFQNSDELEDVSENQNSVQTPKKRTEEEEYYELRVNDIFHELSDENQRLNKELEFANNCLNVFKIQSHLNQIRVKYETTIDSEAQQKFNQLEEEINSLIRFDEQIYEFFLKEISEPEADIREDRNIGQTIEQMEETNGDQNLDNFDDITIIDENREKLSEINICLNDETDIEEDISEEHSNTVPVLSVQTNVGSDLIEDERNGEIRPKENLSEDQNFANKSKKEKTEGNIQLMDSMNEKRKSKRIIKRRTEKDMDYDMSYQSDTQFSKETVDIKTTHRAKGRLKSHTERNNTLEKCFKCPECDQNCRKKFSLVKHINDCHKFIEKTVKCDEEDCHHMFRDEQHMKRHKKEFHTTEQILCDWPECGQTYKYKSSYGEHKKTHLMVTKFKCEDCAKTFTMQKGLAEHEKYHQKRFVCEWPQCDKRFGKNRLLTEHMNRHQNNRSFKCTFNGCPKEYFSSFGLHKHMKNDHK